MDKHIIPDEEWEIVRKYIFGSKSILLVRECVARELGVTEEILNNLENYNHGGDADIWIDVITSSDHYAMGEMRDQGLLPKENANE